MGLRDRIRLIIEKAGYSGWCDACGRDNILTRYECKGAECKDQVDHSDHCHEHQTEMCIPRNLPIVQHWIDCECDKLQEEYCIKNHIDWEQAYKEGCDCHQECACQNP